MPQHKHSSIWTLFRGGSWNKVSWIVELLHFSLEALTHFLLSLLPIFSLVNSESLKFILWMNINLSHSYSAANYEPASLTRTDSNTSGSTGSWYDQHFIFCQFCCLIYDSYFDKTLLIFQWKSGRGCEGGCWGEQKEGGSVEVIELYADVPCADSMLTPTLTYSRVERALLAQNFPEDNDADPNEAIARDSLNQWSTRWKNQNHIIVYGCWKV